VHAFLNEFGTPRLGLSVSRRVGSAVTRNAVRRRLREVFHSALAEMPGSWDVVVSARPEAAEAGLDEMKEEFDRALRKLGEGGKLRDAGPG
jgi:ribonuclease P protein component